MKARLLKRYNGRHQAHERFLTTSRMNSNAPEGNSPTVPRRDRLPAPIKLALSIFGVLTGLAVIGILLVSFMMMMAYPNLPDIDSLAT